MPTGFSDSTAEMYIDYRQGQWGEVLPLITAINLLQGSTLISVISGQKKGERIGYVLCTQPRHLARIEHLASSLAEDGHFVISEFKERFLQPLFDQMQRLA